MTIDLTTQTAREIDTVWVTLMDRRAQAQAQIDAAKTLIEKLDLGVRGYMEYQRAGAMERLEKATTALDMVRIEERPFVAEWKRRGGWARFFLVTNGNGHVHREQNCTTCYVTTQFAWLVELADATEAEMVAEFGEVACTVCFPTAPTMYAELKAKGLMTTRERLNAEERAAKDAEKAAKAAAKAAKAITNPDGTKLRINTWGEIRTVVTARNELTGRLCDVLRYERNAQTRELREGEARQYRAFQQDIELLLAALAHKLERPVEELREEFTAKATKKNDKEGGWY